MNDLPQIIGISPEDMQNILQDLIAMHLLVSESGTYVLLDNYLHLSPLSPIFKAWKAQIRLSGMHRQSMLSDVF